jgi:hypothetical protein
MGVAWLTIKCNTCHEEWHEVFHLKTIHPLDKQGRPIFDED